MPFPNIRRLRTVPQYNGYAYATNGRNSGHYLGDETGDRTAEFSATPMLDLANKTVASWPKSMGAGQTQVATNPPTAPSFRGGMPSLLSPPSAILPQPDFGTPDFTQSYTGTTGPAISNAGNAAQRWQGTTNTETTTPAGEKTPEQQAADEKALFLARGGSERMFNKGGYALGLHSKIDARATSSARNSGASDAIRSGWGWGADKMKLPY